MNVAQSTLVTAAVGLLLCGAAGSSANDLTRQRAVEIALAEDPELARLAHDRAAHFELAVAESALPDPQIALGAQNFPVDTFDFAQEPMTQARIALRQALPRGRTRALARRHRETLAAGVDARILERRLRLARDVTREWLALYRSAATLAVLEASRPLFDELVAVSETLYAVGGRSQQDVLSATLERQRLENRILQTLDSRDRGRAGLGRWIGGAAAWPLASEITSTPPRPLSAEAWLAAVDRHPAVQAAAQSVDASQIRVALAEQHYRPAWQLEVAYGIRRATGADGSELPDFVSAGVTFDLPLFGKNRQSRRINAARSDVDAAAEQRRERVRALHAEALTAQARHGVLSQRRSLFDERVVPTSRRASAAALAGYRADTNDFSAVVRAYIAELDAQIELLAIRVEMEQVAAELGYLAGGDGA